MTAWAVSPGRSRACLGSVPTLVGSLRVSSEQVQGGLGLRRLMPGTAGVFQTGLLHIPVIKAMSVSIYICHRDRTEEAKDLESLPFCLRREHLQFLLVLSP